MLGVEPALGRNFTKKRTGRTSPGRDNLVRAVEEPLRRGAGRRWPPYQVDGRPVLIVGVLPADFELPTLDRADLLIPQALPANPPPGVAARCGSTAACARATPIESSEPGSAALQGMFAEIPPHVRKQVQFHVRSLRDLQTGDFRVASWTLLAAVLAVLLIACSNVANLMLARSVALAA